MSTTTFNHAFPRDYTAARPGASVFTRFIDWCHAQDHMRLFWVGITLVTHGCVITPLAIIGIIFSGPHVPMIPFGLVVLSMAMVLVVNLAALPTKITIPLYVLSIVADIAIVGSVFL